MQGLTGDKPGILRRQKHRGSGDLVRLAPERGSIGAQLVGHEQFRRKPLLSEKLAHQLQCRSGVAAALHQHVENLAFVIDGTPEVHLLASDPNNHLV